MSYAVLPYFKTETGWTLPEDFLRLAWRQIVEAGRVAQTFAGGRVATEEEWIGWLRLRGNYPVFVCHEERAQAVMAAWLNNVAGGFAYAHFCFLQAFVRGAVRAVLNYWQGTGLVGLVGITPEDNEPAIRVTRICGWSHVGSVPKLIERADGSRVAGVVSYYLFGG